MIFYPLIDEPQDSEVFSQLLAFLHPLN